MSASRGNATEAAVLYAFVAAGYDVLVPFGEGHPYDLVIDLGSAEFLRVQCKTARPVGRRFAADYEFERWSDEALLEVARGTWVERESALEFA